MIRLIPLLPVLFFLFTLPSYAQKKAKTPKTKDILFAEIGGNGFLYSFNYEKIIPLKNKHWELTGRLGASYFKRQAVSYAGVPVTVGLLYGDTLKKNRLELSAGFLMANNYFDSRFSPTANLSYRRYFEGGRKFFKFSFTPFYDWQFVDEETDIRREWIFRPWGGIAIGWVF